MPSRFHVCTLPWNDVRGIVDSRLLIVGQNPMLEPRSYHLTVKANNEVQLNHITPTKSQNLLMATFMASQYRQTDRHTRTPPSDGYSSSKAVGEPSHLYYLTTAWFEFRIWLELSRSHPRAVDDHINSAFCQLTNPPCEKSTIAK